MKNGLAELLPWKVYLYILNYDCDWCLKFVILLNSMIMFDIVTVIESYKIVRKPSYSKCLYLLILQFFFSVFGAMTECCNSVCRDFIISLAVATVLM